MATGTVTLHQNERGDFEAVFPIALTAMQDDLSAADQVYVVSPVKANITAVYTVVNTALTVAKSTLAVKAPDGTVGAIEIAHESAVGTIDSLTSSLSNTEVEAGEAIEIENDAAPGAGAMTVTVILGP
jgi:hypothetical protein